jgi:hypothetical protein
MRSRLPANVPLAIVIAVAAAAITLRAAARRPKPRGMPGAEPAPVPATAEDGPPQPAVTSGVHHTADQHMPKPPGAPGRPDASVEQMQFVFHELHAEGRHALCEVCGNQYLH